MEQQDAKRENKVKKLIEKFEKHQRKESYLKDLSQTQEMNEFSKESQELIADMNNTPRSSNFAKILSNNNVLNAILFGDIGLIYCSCGRKYEIFAEFNYFPAEQLRRQLNPWLRY